MIKEIFVNPANNPLFVVSTVKGLAAEPITVY